MSLKKGLSIFLLLSVAMSGTVLFLSVDRSSWAIFGEADKGKLVLVCLLVIAVWLLDASKLYTLTRAAGERIGPGFSLELTWLNYFGAAITPMQSGGGPFQMYLMYRNGISVGKTVAITLVRTILTMMILGMAIPFSFLWRKELPNLGWGMRGFIFYVVLFCLVVWFFIVLSLVRPRIIKRLCGTVIVRLQRVGFLKPDRVIRLLRRVSSEIDAYNQNLWDFMTIGKKFFLIGILVAALQMLAQLSVMPCLIWAMGFEVHYVECVLIQALFLFLLYFIPTPGGSGAAEGGAAFVFSLFVPWNVAGMLGVGWRFLTEYTGIALGAVVAMKVIGWGLANQIMSRKEAEDGEVGKDGGEDI